MGESASPRVRIEISFLDYSIKRHIIALKQQSTYDCTIRYYAYEIRLLKTHKEYFQWAETERNPASAKLGR